ncbi:TetR/AcrR family transcriptional regulator [Corticibacter populi]|uniref:TetR/AcrR family transcriptional regulator n=1 Tax=Corticibacter populi TaxID=1550736 RepID=A0A3M6QPS3_9BURK|nr:TetR/AcrR family transcriptional regulator [Corticibacter populi]RMX05037.1 TetR/AcrR family transcriptional regulator [Corticibacter populi]RZS33526.1 TetR family transcriptional regulator [Corticibacter populi]
MPANAAARKGRIRAANEAGILRAAAQVFAREGYAGASMAQIARQADLPKANLHYYFGSKELLYQRVLQGILEIWLAGLEVIVPETEPRAALLAYVDHKMRLAAEQPEASRLFAAELLQGGPHLDAYFRGAMRALVQAKAAVIDGWIAQGRIAPLDSTHLFFSIWALTQTYADFEVQVAAVLGLQRRERLDAAAWQRATAHVRQVVLRSCGLQDEAPPP